MSSLVAQTRPGAKVAVPVTAPSVIEAVMRRTNGVVARTKTDSRFLMTLSSLSAENVAMAGDLDGGFIFPDFHPAFDGMFAFAKTLEMLSWLQRPLSEFSAELPPMYLSAAQVRCPWEVKGKVMRRLTEDSRHSNGRTELIDGIKLTDSEREWVLVLPDAAEPVFHVYTEGQSQEEAVRRAQEYVGKIESLAV
jgi:mannose-1-phosphate guanylyltransferase/phosphomannomutase